jgi:capsule polysaccharide export protein KpsE/RkpR
MPLSERDREKLERILNLLGSDQPGERASAALAAHRMVQSLGLDWEEILADRPTKVVVQRVREWDVNHRDAAEARIRQLKSTTERQERQIRALRTRINSLNDRERARREAEYPAE